MPQGIIKFDNITEKTQDLIKNNDLKLYSYDGNLYWNDKEIKTKPIISGIISMPPFVINSIDLTTPGYQNMYLAYQNLNNPFDYYIIPQNIKITHLSLFQSQESNAVYIVQVYNDTLQLGNDIEIEINPNESSVRIKLDSILLLSTDNKLKIKIDTGLIKLNSELFINYNFTKSLNNLGTIEENNITYYGTFLDNNNISSNGITINNNNYISVNIGTMNNSFSISLWINVNDASKHGKIFSFNHNDALTSIMLHLDQNLLFFGYYGYGMYSIVTTPGSYNINEWIHVVCILEGNNTTSTTKLYINNLLVDTTNWNASILNKPLNSLTIGNLSSWWGSEVDVQLGSFIVVDKILDANEINSLYNIGFIDIIQEEVIIILDGYYGDNIDYTWKGSSSNLYYDVGNVGIGTSNPTQLLNLYNGSIKVEDTNNNSVIEISGNQITSYKNTNNNIKKSVNFKTNVGINTTNDFFNNNNIATKPILSHDNTISITSENQVSKLTDDADWTKGRVFTSINFSNGCYLRFSSKNTNKLFIIGLRENNPNSDNTPWYQVGCTYYLWYIKHDSKLEIRNNGTYDSVFGAAVNYSNNIPFEIIYDNSYIRYYYNGIEKAYYYVGSNKTFYLDSSYYHIGNGIAVIEQFSAHSNQIPVGITTYKYFSNFNGITNTNSFTFNKTNVPTITNWSSDAFYPYNPTTDTNNINLFKPNLSASDTGWYKSGIHSNIGYTGSFLYKVKFLSRNDMISVGINNNYLTNPDSDPDKYLRYLYHDSWALYGETNGNSSAVSGTQDGSISTAGDIYDMYYINDKIYILKNNVSLSYNIVDNILYSETFDLGVAWGHNTGNPTYTDIQKIEILEFKPLDYLTIPNYISPDLRNTNFTIEFWIKPQFTDKERYCVLFNQGEYSTEKWFVIYLGWNDTDNNLYTLNIKYGSADTGALTYIPYILNISTHICITYIYTTKELNIFINGSKRETKTMERVLNSFGEIYLGKVKQSAMVLPIDWLYKGEIKQFKIYNTILTQNELFENSIKLSTNTIEILNDYDEILLINSNDIHNSQEFIDEAYGNYIFNSKSKVGNFYNSMFISRHTNTESKFGNTSIAFDTDDSNYDYLEIENKNNIFNLGSNDFTIETWVNLKSYSNWGTFIAQSQPAGAGGSAWHFGCGDNATNEGKIVFAITTDGNGWNYDHNNWISTSKLNLNTWYHIASCRENDTIRLFINGTLESSYTLPSNYSIFNSPNNITIGCQQIASNGIIENVFNGYLDSIRITKKAIYTDIFSVPTTRFIPRNKLYYNGTFETSYTIFNGTNNYLMIPNYDNKLDLCNSDFTIEFWTQVFGSSNRTIFSQGLNNVSHSLIQIQFKTNELILDFNGDIITFNISTITVSNWNHYAITYTEQLNDADCFVNASGPKPKTFTTGSNLNGSTIANGIISIGRTISNSNEYFNGFLKKLKLWNKVRIQSEIVESCYYNNNGNNIYNNNASNKDIDSSYLDNISTTSVNNLILYIPFDGLNQNIYTLNYSSDFDTANMHNDNMQIHIPMKNNDKNIYSKNNNKLKIDGYLNSNNVGLYANITTGFTATFAQNVWYHITNDSTYDTYYCSGIDWTLRWCYPDNNIFNKGLFTCPIDGLYDICANIRFDSTGGPYQRLLVSINKNTDVNKMLHNIQGHPSTSYETFHISGCVRLFKNDIVSLAFINANDDINFTLSHTSSFSIVLINSI
jgi:hypothetical protein